MRACGAVKVDGQKQRRERHEMDCMLGEGDGETSAYAERRIVYDRVYAVRRRVSGEKIRVAAYCPNAVSAQVAANTLPRPRSLGTQTLRMSFRYGISASTGFAGVA